MTQPTLWDSIQSGRAKVIGMQVAADNKAELLQKARQVAKGIARRKGVVTADDVQKELGWLGHSPKELGNAAGSLFRGKEWEWTGRYVKSERVWAHSNELKEWRLKS